MNDSAYDTTTDQARVSDNTMEHTSAPSQSASPAPAPMTPAGGVTRVIDGPQPLPTGAPPVRSQLFGIPEDTIQGQLHSESREPAGINPDTEPNTRQITPSGH